ncbi:hypothetical protein PF010_g12166 [Phytophthora fragariae]|uniref:Uncharacterized protein n=1 Tax=Phytophthora fragariae TaxID=53985 RepID=A0A6A3LHW5_9STRA|nr:hypothetical protein PF011_g5991 [Phytophthora fragariae]KAE9107758.1 hypothetical protein PF010_g12166 [Phytophthora fragariae]KAE9108573.1 hypothetical protein PF007_g12603 [Phytophthora fragariae]KAE9226282.1 hypothetical protein PF004_g11687 [Phytophthora fragariae]
MRCDTESEWVILQARYFACYTSTGGSELSVWCVLQQLQVKPGTPRAPSSTRRGTRRPPLWWQRIRRSSPSCQERIKRQLMRSAVVGRAPTPAPPLR